MLGPNPWGMSPLTVVITRSAVSLSPNINVNTALLLQLLSAVRLPSSHSRQTLKVFFDVRFENYTTPSIRLINVGFFTPNQRPHSTSDFGHETRRSIGSSYIVQEVCNKWYADVRILFILACNTPPSKKTKLDQRNCFIYLSID